MRPVTVDDAQFIIDVRLEDAERNQFIHRISEDLSAQQGWIDRYLERDDDYYFVVENKLGRQAEGLISIYDIADGRAEWGRWVIAKGSFAATESLELMFKAGFDHLHLDELFCRTIADNRRVVSIHDSLPQLTRGRLDKFVLLNGVHHDVIEHYTNPTHYTEHIAPGLEKKALKIFQRNLSALIGRLEFHHIGIATHSIEEEFRAYRFLGYSREDAKFEDPEQGIRGQFITAANQPRLELLENLEGSDSLDVWLDNRVKMYHFAYKTRHFDTAIKVLNQNRIRTVSPPKRSVYFKQRICFLMLSPGFLIELIEA